MVAEKRLAVLLFTLDNIFDNNLLVSYLDMGHVGHSILSANIISRNNNINNLRNW